MDVLHDFGIEDEPHITCQYGFHSDVTVDDITEFVNLHGKKIRASLGDITTFNNDDYDVVKVDVDSPDLQELSEKIREHFKGKIEITFPEYHPHVTLAYVKKDSMPFADDTSMFNGKNYVFKDFVYSTALEEQFDIKKGKRYE